ncbi:MAG: hypothetical protein ABSF67_16265 [Roseiarcus sp.]
MKLDGDAAGEMSNDAGSSLSDSQRRTDGGRDRNVHRRALARDVNQCRDIFFAIRRRDNDLSVVGFDALLPTIVRRAKPVMLDEPGDPSSKLFDFARRRGDLERETTLKLARDLALHTAELVDIGDDVIANLPLIAAFDGYAARRQIDCRA